MFYILKTKITAPKPSLHRKQRQTKCKLPGRNDLYVPKHKLKFPHRQFWKPQSNEQIVLTRCDILKWLNRTVTSINMNGRNSSRQTCYQSEKYSIIWLRKKKILGHFAPLFNFIFSLCALSCHSSCGNILDINQISLSVSFVRTALFFFTDYILFTLCSLCAQRLVQRWHFSYSFDQ